MGIFTGAKLGTFVQSGEADYFRARKVINGRDRAEDIKEYALTIEKCIKFNDCENEE